MATDQAKSKSKSRWGKLKPPRLTKLSIAIVLGLFFGIAGIVIGYTQELPEDLEKPLYAASVTLIFGGVFTAIVKLLIEDHKMERQRKADQEQFVRNILADLKSVYDRVERARIVIAAHQSALTYGKEMRDLIDSRVQLRNVVRALDGQTKEFGEKRRKELKDAVKAMEDYLKELTETFKTIYRPASIAQSAFEAAKKRIIEDKSRSTDELKKLDNDIKSVKRRLSSSEAFA